jgi:hypothetical protein
MRELLAERAPRTLIAVAAVATLALGGAAIRHAMHHGHGHHLPFAGQCGGGHAMTPAPHAPIATGTSRSVDLDGDGVPEVVTMTFSEDAGSLTTHITVDRLEGPELIGIGGAAMDLVAPLDPAPCIGTAVAWPASSPGGGRIELTDYARAPQAGGYPTCEPAGTRIFRLRGGQMLEAGIELPTRY